jgi:site-specific DNA recombinase
MVPLRKKGAPGRAVIYVRVSTEQQVDNTSLDYQEAECRRHCEHERLEVVDLFREEGVSAKTADRPQLWRMINFSSKRLNRVSDVVVLESSRFSRSLEDRLALEGRLKRGGIRLTFVREPNDDDANTQFSRIQSALWAEHDNNLRSERAIAGMAETARSGRWNHVAPLGYRTGDRKIGEPSLVPIPGVAELITQGFQLMANGQLKQIEVLEKLHGAGLRTKSGQKVTRQTFSELLRRPAYMGRVRQEWCGVDVKADFDAIVDEQTFERVQSVLKGRPVALREHSTANPEFPLCGTLRCHDCGAPLRGSFSRSRNRDRHGYYACQTRECSQRSVRQDWAHLVVLERLAGLGASVGLAGALEAVLRRALDRRQAATKTMRKSLEQKVAQADVSIRRIEGLYRGGKIDDESYQTTLSDARKDRGAARSALVEHDELNDVDFEGLLRFANHALANLPSLWLEADVVRKKRIQGSIFPRGIEIADKEVRTAETSSLFSYLGSPNGAQSRMAPRAGLEPATR